MGSQILCVGQGVHQALKLRACIADFALGAVYNVQRIEEEPTPKRCHRKLMSFAFKKQHRKIKSKAIVRANQQTWRIIWWPQLDGRLVFAFAIALIYDGVQNSLCEGEKASPSDWEGRTSDNVALRYAMNSCGCLRAWRSQDFFWYIHNLSIASSWDVWSILPLCRRDLTDPIPSHIQASCFEVQIYGDDGA